MLTETKKLIFLCEFFYIHLLQLKKIVNRYNNKIKRYQYWNSTITHFFRLKNNINTTNY